MNSQTRKRTGTGLSSMVMKAMGLFTGLQMFNILCALIKMKLVALWLHATGVGLFGIYNNTTETISSLTDLGLRQSAIRDVAQSAGNPGMLARTVALVRRWSRLAGILGALVISSLSPLISNWFFGNYSHWWEFMTLSAAMLMNALINGEQAILQGSNRLRLLARSGFYGTFAGLLISIPLFRFAGNPGIVASIIVYSSAMLVALAVVRYRRPKNIAPQKVSLQEGKGFAQLGAYMAIATFISNLAQVGFLAYLNRKASTDMVGYFQAGYMIVIRYAGLLFSAVAVEYYPRLAANIQSKKRLEMFVSHEGVLLSLLLIPFLLLFYLFRNTVVDILYTPDFSVIVPFISWGAVGIPLRALSQCLGYMIAAKGDGRIYALTECTDAAIGLTLNIALFNAYGLIGLGYAYILWYLSYTIITGAVYYLRYKMRISGTALFLTALCLLLCFAANCTLTYCPAWVNIAWMGCAIPLSTLFFIRFIKAHR